MNERIITVVEWADSIGCVSGWCRESELTIDCDAITTIGVVLREDYSQITICPTFYKHPDGEIHTMGVVTIPKCAIVSRQEFDRKHHQAKYEFEEFYVENVKVGDQVGEYVVEAVEDSAKFPCHTCQHARKESFASNVDGFGWVCPKGLAVECHKLQTGKNGRLRFGKEVSK